MDTNSFQDKSFVIIDGKSVFYRGYYAMPHLTNDQGISTGGIYGFLTLAFEAVNLLNPDFIAIAWDKPKTNIRARLKLYPEYKAGRKPAPADFYSQIPILHDILASLHWPLFECDDYEADDIMGTLASKATSMGLQTKLISSDLDLLQLISPKVDVYLLKKGLSNIEKFSDSYFTQKYGLRVDQFLDLKALKGDSSDNIPGVAGIGEKTAVNLLKTYDNLANIYDNIELLPDKIKTKLINGRESADLSKKLAEIWLDAPIDLDFNKMQARNIDFLAVQKQFKKLQFKSLEQKLTKLVNPTITRQALSSKFNIFKAGYLINSILALQKCQKTNQSAKQVVLTSIISQNKLVYLCLCFNEEAYYIIDVAKISETALINFINALPKIVGYNLKQLYRQLVFQLPGVKLDCYLDIFLAALIGHSNYQDLNLASIARVELGQDLELSDYDFKDLASLKDVISQQLSAISRLQSIFVDLVKKNKQYNYLLFDLDMPLIEILIAMEQTGIKLDLNYLAKLNQEVTGSIADLSQNIYKLAGTTFNIASPAQLSDILFTKLKLSTQGIKKGKQGYSTAYNELEKIKDLHPIIVEIQNFRELSKLKNTYIDTLPSQTDNNSLVHTTFIINGAQTGRLSSIEPNLQNIPIRSSMGKKIRTAFVTRPNKKFISADYSQFELRIAAVLANDQELVDMFNRGADIHLNTASLIYGRSPEDVTKEMRSAAKTINFGILYGMSPHGLSNATGMSLSAASEFISKYKTIRQPLFNYMDELLDRVRNLGYAETLFGRRRYFKDINSANYILRSSAERAAINMPIQGTEADLMKLAMIKVGAFLKSIKQANLLLQIHDSLIVEVLEEDAEECAYQIQDIMQSVYKLDVRLDVDYKIGDNWGDL